MTFRLTCPVCGKREVYEFTYGGEERGAPAPQATVGAEEHYRHVQFRTTRTGPQEEWWYHRLGCGVWFKTWRNPATNREEPPSIA